MHHRAVPLILASASPRRKKLLKAAGFNFQVWVSNVIEDLDANDPPPAIARRLAEQKTREVAQKFPDHWVIGADTIVVLKDQILGKPEDKETALKMLIKLNGKSHKVITAVCIINRKRNQIHHLMEVSKVIFKDNPRSALEAYVNTAEPLDKAGGYAVQGRGSELIARVVGDRDNVIGFPITKFIEFYQTHILTPGVE